MAGRPKVAARCVVAEPDWTLWTAFEALGDPVRLRIVRMLRDREQCVCHLTEALGLSQGTVSHHMGILKRAGLVRDRRDEMDTRWTYYSLDSAGLAALRAALEELSDTAGIDSAPADCRDSGNRHATSAR